LLVFLSAMVLVVMCRNLGVIHPILSIVLALGLPVWSREYQKTIPRKRET